MDLSSRLRAIVRGNGPERPRELTYEPDTGRYEATIDVERVADVLGGRVAATPHGLALVIDRRYESDRCHGSLKIRDCELGDGDNLRLLDPTLPAPDGCGIRTLFVDLETTGLSGGAGTVAFLVGCGWFDLGAFQIRQFLLTSFAAERALLSAVAACFDDTALLVTYNGKTFDVPMMETRWMFHRMAMPLQHVRHFDMLHPARRLWRARAAGGGPSHKDDDGGCRLSTLERVLFDVTRAGDIPGMDIPARFFRFLRSGDATPLEPVLEHNRLDLVSLAGVTAHAVRLVEEGGGGCRDASEALALGRIYERGASADRAAACYARVAYDELAPIDLRAEALYRSGLCLRRERRYAEAAVIWRRLLDLKSARGGQRTPLMVQLRRFAAEALAIHYEHRDGDLTAARELALLALEHAQDDTGVRHRLARLDRKIIRKNDSHLFA